MPQFAYRVRDSGGRLVEGLLDGDNAAAIAKQLQTQGLIPISIQLRTREGSPRRKPSLRRRAPSMDDLMLFCRQMSTLAKSGVPITRGLSGLAETSRNACLAQALKLVVRDVETGHNLSHAFNQHSRVFPPILIGILQVGENSGRVDESFRLLAAHFERERDTRTKMQSAVRYPLMVLGAIAVAMVVINLFVIPAFAKVFAGLKAELPWATQILLTTSQFAVQYWPIVLGASTLSVWLALRFIATARGRLWWDGLKLRLPVVGPVINHITMGRFARTFAMMMKSGVPISQGLVLLAEAVDNRRLGLLILNVRRGIERGELIARAAGAQKFLPPLALQMLEVGEESGRLDEMLDELAAYYDREADVGLANLNSAIEPILILVVGVMVLILALGVFLPIWDLGKAAIKH